MAQEHNFFGFTQVWHTHAQKATGLKQTVHEPVACLISVLTYEDFNYLDSVFLFLTSKY